MQVSCKWFMNTFQRSLSIFKIHPSSTATFHFEERNLLFHKHVRRECGLINRAQDSWNQHLFTWHHLRQPGLLVLIKSTAATTDGSRRTLCSSINLNISWNNKRHCTLPCVPSMTWHSNEKTRVLIKWRIQGEHSQPPASLTSRFTPESWVYNRILMFFNLEEGLRPF